MARSFSFGLTRRAAMASALAVTGMLCGTASPTKVRTDCTAQGRWSAPPKVNKRGRRHGAAWLI
jgi:hypothetical protein